MILFKPSIAFSPTRFVHLPVSWPTRFVRLSFPTQFGDLRSECRDAAPKHTGRRSAEWNDETLCLLLLAVRQICSSFLQFPQQKKKRDDFWGQFHNFPSTFQPKSALLQSFRPWRTRVKVTLLPLGSSAPSPLGVTATWTMPEMVLLKSEIRLTAWDV